ncbi:hypothetical protein A4G18_01890 [Pasteurellaceae bacterium Pebbles2]|nr:hypothetical protein [Pasteurellaceae bacterium Pebbles2]
MKFRLAAVAVTALFASSASLAGVVTSSSNIDFLAIDGQKASKTLLKDVRSFNINDNNTHQVVVRVSELVREGSDRTLFESDPIIVTFQGSSEDLQISAPRLSNEREAAQFKDKPVITVKSASGKVLETKQDYLKQEGFLPGVNLVDNLSDYNSSGAVAAVPALATATMPAAMATVGANGKVQKGKITVQGENAAEQMLQYWYQQADKETQQRFLNWVKNQK